MNCDVGRTIEVTSTLPFARLVLNADRHLFHTLLVELANVVSIVIDDVDVVILVDLDAVRARHSAVKHRAEQIAFRVEHAYRIGTPIEDVDVVLRIDRH